MNNTSPSMEDLSQLTADDFERASQSGVVTNRGIINNGLEQNPDDAAEAMGIADITGQRAPWVAQNLDDFKADLRQRTAHELVLNNPDLVEYIQSHPLAASVSNDDWHNLDKFTRESSGGVLQQVHRLLNTPFDKIQQGMGEGLEGGWAGGGIENSPELQRALDPAQNKLGLLGSLASRLVYGGADVAGRALGAGMGLVGGAGKGLAETLGENPEAAQRDVDAVFNLQMAESGMHGHAPEAAPKPKPLTGAEAARPWTEAGVMPPTGLHPEIDAAKAELNSKMVDAVEKDLANLAASTTRERAPDLAGWLAERSYADMDFYVKSDAALGLYGEKVPAIDDGLLGWVPDIEKQLAAARETDADIRIPAKDYFKSIDPEVAKALHDDLRMWDTGVTAREAKEAPTEPREVIAEALPQIRASAELEPKFGMGNRKLQLQAGRIEPGDQFHPEVHNFDLLDEHGKSVGNMEIIPGPDKKTLYVNWIGGDAGLWANSFGPRLIIDLKRQLKAQYPEYESITGHRVSGAREGVNNFGPMPVPKVRLDAEDAGSVTDMQRTFANAFLTNGMQFAVTDEGRGIRTMDLPKDGPGQIAADKLSDTIKTELDRIAPGAEVKTSMGIRIDGDKAGGLYVPYADKPPTIILDLLNRNPMGTARHEAVHYLRGYGFITEGEWSLLEKAAGDEGWLERYGIHDRYADLDDERKLEEAVAEGFREWAEQAPEVRPKTGIGAVFQKIMDLFDRIKEKLGFGPEVTWEDVFAQIQSGEVGARGPGAPREGAFDLRASTEKSKYEQGIELHIQNRQRIIEKYKGYIKDLGEPGTYEYALADQDGTLQNLQEKLAKHQETLAGFKQELARLYNARNMSDLPGVSVMTPKFSRDMADRWQAITEGRDNLQAEALGLPKDSHQRAMKALDAQRQADLASAQKRATAEQTKRQGDEWKANRAEMAKEVSAEIRGRPDIAADLFLGSGEMNGVKLRQRYTLRAEDLTPEQIAALPEHYVSKNGIPVDGVASMFGYSSREELVSRLTQVDALKVGADGERLPPGEFMRKMVQSETDRRMEAKYGNLAQNVASDALDQALSESSINVMHEELRAAADAAGVTVPGKAELQARAKEIISGVSLRGVNAYKTLQDSGRIGHQVQQSLIAKDYAAAVPLMQKQTLTAMVAAEAKAVAKEMGQFDKLAKQMAKREVKSMSPEYTNWVHDVLMRIGKPVRRTPADMVKEIRASGYGNTLEDFVAGKADDLRELAVWDQLYDRGWRKGYKDLSVEEFRAVKDTVTSLVHNGREEQKIIYQGKEMDFDTAREQLLAALAQFKDRDMSDSGKGASGNLVTKLPRTGLAHSLQLENIFGRWDKFNPYGPWTQLVLRDLIEGVNRSDVVKKETAAKLGALADKVDLKESVPNPLFRAPDRYGGQLLTMDRGMLRATILNLGNQSNLIKLAKGWGVEPGDIHTWAMQHATKADFDFAQGVWDMFNELKAETDKMYRNLSGVAPKSHEPLTLVTPHGTYRGGYYPVVFHEVFEGTSPKLRGSNGLKGEGFESAVTPAGHTKSRTEYYAPLTMNLDRLPQRLSQEIHDTYLRPAVINASKVFKDPRISAKITTGYGKEYSDMLVPWLRGVANSSNAMTKDGAVLQGVSDFMRQNLITTLIGFNPGTVMKHGPTAAVLSAREVGAKKFFSEAFHVLPEHFADSIRGLFGINDETSDLNWKFALKNSDELQRRDRNWQETLYGANAGLTGTSGFSTWRQRIMQWGSKPVALSDMISAVPTWLAKYKEAMEEHGEHGNAVFEADRAVRRAHGSMAVTNRPHLTNYVSPWMTSVYNFFNDVMNRQVETVWKAGDALGQAKDGQHKAAMAAVPALVGSAFAYAVWPAITEHWVSPASSKPDDSWAKRSAKAMLYTAGSSWVGIREFANAMMEFKNPDVGLLSTEGKMLTDLARDLFGKQHPFSQEHAQKLIRDATGFTGALTGMTPREGGNIASFGYGLHTGQERPKGPWGWLVGGRYGTLKGHSQTFHDYLQGRSQ